MPCESTGERTELDFVRGLLSRGAGQCLGPVLAIELSPWRPFELDRILGSPRASALLWGAMGVDWNFRLCAAHWLDLACWCWMRAQSADDFDWAQQAQQLLEDLCVAAHWDAKEIVNMLAWQRARLT